MEENAQINTATVGKISAAAMPRWEVKKDGSSYWLDGPGTDGLKYQDRRGDVLGQRDALEAAFRMGYAAGVASK